MKKMMLCILKVMILQFIFAEGQIVRDPRIARNNLPANFSPNTYNSYNNRAPSNYSPYNTKAPSNYSPNDNRTPSNYSPYNNRASSNYSPYNRPPTNYSPYNDRAPRNYSPYNRAPSDYSPYTNRAPRNYSSYNNRAPRNNSHYNNRSPSNYSPYTSRTPSNYNPANKRPRNKKQDFPFYIYYQTDPLKTGRIVCLFTAAKFLKSGFKPTMIPARLCTIVNYEFATLNSTTYEINPGHPDLDYGEKFYEKTVGLKYYNPYLKVFLSLGGWTDSTKKYSDLVASPKKVKNFITKAVKFLKDNKFDGLDVAWEYPNCWQGALGVSPNDKPNYAKFLQKIRKAFDRENLLLSISVSSIKREIKAGYDAPAVAKAVHFINVMTYDMHGPWEKKTGHHSQFGETPSDSDPYLNSKAALEYWASLGVPKIKLNMGIATYATTFTLKNTTKHGLSAPAKGPGKAGALSNNAGTLYYREICQYLDAGNWTEEEDKDAGYYAYSGDQWAGYDHPRMVVKKTNWIAENGYGGLLIKDVSGDDYEQKCFTKRFPLIWIAGMEFRLSLERKQ